MKTQIFVTLLLVFALVFLWGGCSKIGPVEPEQVPADTVYVPVVDTTDVAVYGLMAIIACEPNNGPQIDSIRTYIREGDPPQDNPWPNANSNYTPVNPNWMEPGTYMVIGRKAGYYEASTVVTVSADTVNPVIAYLVMHKIETEPVQEDACLEVTSEPSGAEILLDGVMPWPDWPIGYTITPSGVNVIEPGEHAITVSLAGYVSQSASFTSKCGDTTRLHFVLVAEEVEPDRFFSVHFDGDTLDWDATVMHECDSVEVVLNGSTNPLYFGNIEVMWNACLERYILILSELPYPYNQDDYTEVAFIYHINCTVHVWHYHSYKLIGVHPNQFDLQGVRFQVPGEETGDGTQLDGWFMLIYP